MCHICYTHSLDFSLFYEKYSIMKHMERFFKKKFWKIYVFEKRRNMTQSLGSVCTLNIISDSVWSHMNNWITPTLHSLKLGNSIGYSWDQSGSCISAPVIIIIKDGNIKLLETLNCWL